jgi:peroxiredoxin
MKTISLFISLTVVFVLLFAASAAGGPAKLAPANPKWGDTVTVTYDPAVKGAKFLVGDTIYIYYELKFPEFSKNGWAKMAAKDGTFLCDIRIPEGASFIRMDFMTMDGWDQNAVLGSMIFRKDGVPAKGAWLWKMAWDYSETGYLEAFKNERKLYPDNYLIYRSKWWADANFKKDSLKDIVGREIETLKKPGIKESPGLLWALSCGYLLVDDEKASREVLRRMVQVYPDREDTVWALHEYYQAYSKQLQGEGLEEVNRLKLELLRRDPRSKNLRDYILQWFSYEKDAPLDLDLVRAACEAWIKDEPENPKPYCTLVTAFLKNNSDMNIAAELIAKALDRLIAGKLRLFGDTTGRLTEKYLLDSYVAAAAIHEKLGDFSAALAEIKAAQALSKENRPDLFMREASIWRNLRYFNKAEKSLLEASRRGAKNADEELKEIYRQRRQSDEGFEAWLAEETKKQSAAPGDKKPAPGFEVKALDGETLRLADLKGKVVVLNFWYIGCVPCQVEIPGLNKLVEEFKPEEVVFIGFALDDESHLREFLEKTPFKYRIVARSSSIAKQYGASAYPTHVFINKQGLIEFIMIGGSPKRHEELRPVIQSLLK